MKTRVLLVAVVLVMGLPGARPAFGQDSLASARELYGSAAYEEALVVLDRMKGSGPLDEARQVQQVRALCLLALGRQADAEQAIEAVIGANASYEPDPTITSPRVQAAFRDVRQKLLPGIAQQRYAAAKSAFDRKDYWSAIEGFDAVLALIGPEDASMRDLRTLVVGFRDLARSAMPVAQAAEPVAQTKIDELPPLPAPAPRAFYGPEDKDVLPPGIISQRMPPWTGPGLSSLPGARRSGAIEVQIDEAGNVEWVAVRVKTGTMYDEALADQAGRWKYRPATKKGVPVKYRKAIHFAIQ